MNICDPVLIFSSTLCYIFKILINNISIQKGNTLSYRIFKTIFSCLLYKIFEIQHQHTIKNFIQNTLLQCTNASI